MAFSEVSYNEAAIKSLQLLLISKYGYFVAETLVVLDILLTLDLEVNLVWGRRPSPGKILFLLNRYIPPANMGVDLYFWFGNSPPLLLYEFHAFNCARAETPAILALRTYALYQTRWSIYLLGFGVVVPWLILTITDMYMYGNALDWNILESGVGCIPECTSEKICTLNVVMYWIHYAGFDTMVVWLTAWKAYTLFRARRGIVRDSPADQIYPYSGFLRLLFRDGFIYYSCILTSAVLNILVGFIAPRELILFSISTSRAFQTVACSRVFLNLRGSLEVPFPTLKMSTARERQQSIQLVSMHSDIDNRTSASHRNSTDGPSTTGSHTRTNDG
ncbi:hypothetical protein C8J56DRAFT_1139843 [Mycena floridula]|nr:hypothetical protein C8J56DRAFT_1139843 [Mycena floridula]